MTFEGGSANDPSVPWKSINLGLEWTQAQFELVTFPGIQARYSPERGPHEVPGASNARFSWKNDFGDPADFGCF